jgi:peptide subunit release factor RF-3
VIERIASRSDVMLTRDSDGHYVALFRESFYLRYTGEKNPELHFEAKS